MQKESIYLHLNTHREAKVQKAYYSSTGYTKWSRVKEISKFIDIFSLYFRKHHQQKHSIIWSRNAKNIDFDILTKLIRETSMFAKINSFRSIGRSLKRLYVEYKLHSRQLSLREPDVPKIKL